MKRSGIGDVSVQIKESGFAGVSSLLTESSFPDVFIYSESGTVSKEEIIAALIDLIRSKAEK